VYFMVDMTKGNVWDETSLTCPSGVVQLCRAHFGVCEEFVLENIKMAKKVCWPFRMCVSVCV